MKPTSGLDPDSFASATVPLVKPTGFREMAVSGEPLTGQRIVAVNTVDGVRVTVEDGTWGLVRVSSNKPELVVVVESPVSDERMRAMFKAVDGILRENDGVGAYDRTV